MRHDGVEVKVTYQGAQLAEALDTYQRRRHGVNEAVVAYGHSLVTSFEDKARFAACFNGALQGSSRQRAHLNAAAASALA